MRNKNFIISMFLIIILSSCNSQNEIYKTVKIGNQTWMVKNLDVSTFRNGDPIPEVKTEIEWEKLGKEHKPAWCYYNNKRTKEGKLYNWYAMNDPRGLAPIGWHVPGRTDWEVLFKFVSSNPNRRLLSEDSGGTNESGFSGLLGGIRSEDGLFHGKGNPEEENYAEYWCKDLEKFDAFYSHGKSITYVKLSLDSDYDYIDISGSLTDNYNGEDYSQDKSSGRFVRCIKD